ncbi:MAG TPA: hypothetical protein VGO09_08735 [Flavisolibacter sp.]|nr:hypothetical protein [Flavisolibacter sp.]
MSWMSQVGLMLNYRGIQRLIVPDELYKKYFSVTRVDNFDNTEESFIHLIRLIRMGNKINGLEFYSKQINTNSYYATTNEFINLCNSSMENIKKEISLLLKHDLWIEKTSADTNFLFFQYHDLELTVMFEILPDVYYYPFWNELVSYNENWSADHQPTLHQYMHFIVRMKTF